MKHVLAILIFLLTGCEAESVPTSRTTYSLNGGYVHEFRLQDGTRCVSKGNSITCDWRTPEVE